MTNEYVVIDGKRYAAVAGVGATIASGESAGLVVAEISNLPTPAAENVYFENFTLDATAASTHIINNAENYSVIQLKITNLAGSATISVVGDMSPDQSGDYTAKMAMFSQSAHPNSGTAHVNLVNNNCFAREKLVYSAYKIYVSTTDGSGGTPDIAFAMKGLV